MIIIQHRLVLQKTSVHVCWHMGVYLKQWISSDDNSKMSSLWLFVSEKIISEIFFIYDNPRFFDKTSDRLSFGNSMLRSPSLNLFSKFWRLNQL